MADRVPVLLVLDCDGTLLDPDGVIRPAVRAAVRTATAGGALVTLATARRLYQARGFAADLGLTLPLVVQDGAVVQDPATGEVLHEDALTPAALARLVDAAVAHGLHPVVSRVGGGPDGDVLHALDGVDDDPAMRPYLAARSPVRRGDRTSLLVGGGALRLVAFGPEERTRAYAAAVRAWVEDDACVVREYPPDEETGLGLHLVQLTAFGCTKARAVRALAARHGLALDRCVVVGDGENDIELLTAVRDAGGVAVAMGQASAAVRAAATDVVASNADDGVAEAVERFVLPVLSARL